MTSHRSPSARAADRFGFCLRGSLIDIEQCDLGAGCRERFCRRKADGAGGAGDDGDLARQRQLPGTAQFRLLQRPVFDIEQIGLRQRLEAADRLGIRDGGNRSLREIGGDFRVLLAASKAEQADARHQHHPRYRIEHSLDAADARIVAVEIAFVIFAIRRDSVADRILEAAEVAIRRARPPQAAGS